MIRALKHVLRYALGLVALYSVGLVAQFFLPQLLAVPVTGFTRLVFVVFALAPFARFAMHVSGFTPRG